MLVSGKQVVSKKRMAPLIYKKPVRPAAPLAFPVDVDHDLSCAPTSRTETRRPAPLCMWGGYGYSPTCISNISRIIIISSIKEEQARASEMSRGAIVSPRTWFGANLDTRASASASARSRKRSSSLPLPSPSPLFARIDDPYWKPLHTYPQIPVVLLVRQRQISIDKLVGQVVVGIADSHPIQSKQAPRL